MAQRPAELAASQPPQHGEHGERGQVDSASGGAGPGGGALRPVGPGGAGGRRGGRVGVAVVGAGQARPGLSLAGSPPLSPAWRLSPSVAG